MSHSSHRTHLDAETPTRRWLTSLRVMLASPLLLMVLFGFTGCEVFSLSSLDKSKTAAGLPPLRPSPNTIGLRYTFVERPVGDPLLCRDIWIDASEILNGNDPELSKSLARNGYRIGWISSFPDALQELISRPGQEHEVALNSSQPVFAGNSLFVRHGDPFIIKTGDVFPLCELSLYREKDDLKPESLTLNDAHGLFKVTAYKEQDGWASLSFIPEFLHGSERVRPIASETSWEPTYSKDTESLYGQKFKLDMNVGDTAIITSRENAPGTPGYFFFRGAGQNSDIQRALLIRLIHVPTRTDLADAGEAGQ